MNKEEENILRVFETRVRQLILKCKDMENDIQNLQSKVESQNQTIEQLNNKNEELQKEFNALKMAKIIEVSGEDVQDTKKKLTKLIKDVDKCISLLNV